MTHLDEVIGQLSSIQGSVVVGLSGGADSAVLAHCAIEAGLQPGLLFVNHGLAGSDTMERAASRVADHLGVPLTIVQAEMHGTSETEARRVRYTMFEQVDAATILLGHTLSDQAETVLMHLLRGSGPVGMAGIPRKRGQFLRPLMDLPRLQLRNVAKTLGLPYADDPENDSPSHLRNWVRSSVIPLLQDRSPDVERLLARTASLTTRPKVYSVEVGPAALLPLAILRTLSAPQRSESLREAVRRLRPPYPASFSEVSRMEEVVFGGAPRAELEGAIVVLRDRTSLFVGPTPDVPRPVKVANGVRWGRWSFSENPRRRISSLWSRVPRASIVRGAVVGDTLSMGRGSKDVFSALAESGVPRELRFCWPVIEHDGDVVWVPGIRRAPEAEEINEGYLGLDATEETW